MSHQKGSTVVFKLGYELVAFGTPAAAGYILPINTFDVRGTRALNKANTLQSSRNPREPFAGNVSVGGNIVVPIDSMAMAYWLIAMFGLPTSSGAGTPWTHEFKIPSVQRSLTLETAFTDLATDKFQRFVGCKVNSFGLTVGGDGELVATLGVIGKGQSFEAATFHAGTSITMARVNNFQAALLEGGGALANATELSINIGFPMDPYYVIGGAGSVGSIAEQLVEVSGNIKTLFEDDSLLAKALAGTESSLKLTVTNTANSVFELEIQELLYELNSVPVSGPQGLLVDLNFQGYYANGGEASAIVARLTNTFESYAAI
jgi:hypothetical protein